MKIPSVLYSIARIFNENGFECMLVGGATRDLYMKREVNDFDLATN
ncbi:MAG: hypothetical protein JW969_18110, partial [Spirochaetales bacterium]|nr:hypothetical protein [Spirochaetales bacterium]